MQSFSPSDLPAHRTFFTEFDKSTEIGTVPTEAVDRVLMRKLKLLLLTKSHVVIAASHLLESEVAHRIILKHPDLISSGAIVSSMKSRHPSTNQFLDEKRNSEGNKNPGFLSSQAAEVASLIDTSGSVVRWKLTQMSDWFRDRLVSDLRNDQSLLQATADRQQLHIPKRIADRLENHSGLSRAEVEKIALEETDRQAIFLINAYSDFLYYLSGARTTDSLGILPQENFLDFTFSELLGRKAGMSDGEIFFKIFIDTIKARTETIFPEEFLDIITVDEALELREIGLQKGFVDGYNSIQLKTKQAISLRDPERLVLILKELDQLENDLKDNFNFELERELTSRARETKQRAAGKAIKTLTTMALPSGLDPSTYKELCVATLELLGRGEAAEAVKKRIQKGQFALEKILEDSKVLDRQPLLDFVSEMNRRYTDKLL